MAHEPSENEPVNHTDPDTDAALDWFLRLQDTPDDPVARAGFEAWRAGSPSRGEAYARLERMQALPSLRKATEKDAARLRYVSPRRTPRYMPRWSVRLAAAAALLFLISGLSQLPDVMLWLQSDYMTAAGERRVIQLPDGSRTILNTASAIAIDFKDGRRQVKLLDGEAYFDVVADAQRPFVVAGPLSTVEVKGTAFSVRAANAEDTVFLERGTVDVSRSLARSEQIRLTPGKTISTTSASLGTVRDADMKLALAWLDGRIIFQNQPFAAALKDLSRYFNGRVVVAPMRTPSIAVSGNYRLDDPETAIRTLAATVGLSATSVPGGILMLY